MNSRTTSSHDALERALRDRDPAGPAPIDPSTDERARAMFDRIVRTDAGDGVPADIPGHPGGRRGTAPSRRLTPPIRRAAAVGGLAALIGIGSVLAPSLFGGTEALAWSARPQGLSPAEARQAEEACDAQVRELGDDLDGTDLSGLRPVVTERRGSLVLVHETDGRPAPSSLTCYVQGGRVVASGGSAATAASQPLPPPAADSLHGELGAVYSTSGGSIRGVTGRVGSDVVAVVLDSVARGPVTATVVAGHFAAWWPDAPTTEAKENAATAPEITGATVTLRDGSTRRVTVEELSGRTTEELGAPDEGGSASAG